MVSDSPVRLRRSCLVVPGSSVEMMLKAASLDSDEVIIDLEDAVPPSAKNESRATVAKALTEETWRAKTLAVRVNAVETAWCYRDIDLLLARASSRIDCLVIPKVERVSHVHFVEHLLDQVECAYDVAVPVGLELQIETVQGLVAIERIAAASTRVEALVFGPGDYAASAGMPQLTVGAVDERYPGHQWHYPLSRIATTARARGLQAIDGPFAAIHDLERLRSTAVTSRLLGFDGRWAIHPGQIGVLNEVYSPTQEEFDRAERLLEAYNVAVEAGTRGAIALEGEMVDEATRKLALAIARRGRAVGMRQS